MMRTAVAGVVASIALTGCIGLPLPLSSATPSPSVNADRKFATVVELRDAAVAAGYPCPSWMQDNKVTLAAQSGSCSTSDVFSIYLTEADVSTAIQKLKAFGESTVLAGPNWVINTSNPEHLAMLRSALGGTVVGRPAATRPSSTTPPSPSPKIPLAVTDADQIMQILAANGLSCTWEPLSQGQYRCQSPEAMLFVDPRPDLKPSMVESTKKLYTAKYVGAPKGMVFSGDNWVVGASHEASDFVFRATWG